MITMTEQAIETVKRLESSDAAPQGAGLRIASDPDNGGLSLRLAAAPHQGDEVIDRSGALLFLDHEAATMLADKTLDAKQQPDGRIQFMLADGEPT
jgi:iron-sulfur cluster assembly protein